MNIELNKKQTIKKRNTNELSLKAQQEIRDLLPQLPETFNWELSNQQGRLAKRIKKYLWKEHKYNLPQTTWECITQTISKDSNQQGNNPNEIASADMVNELCWQAGEFGEKKTSCWWPNRDYSQSPTNLFAAGGFALRFYSANGDGLARAMVIPHGEHYCVFNAYGIAKHEAAHKLAELLNFNPSDNTEVHHDIPEAIYVNDDKLIAVGPYKLTNTSLCFAIEWEEEGYQCSDCGAYVDEYSIYSVGPYGDMVCEDCYSDNYIHCDGCQESHHIDYATEVNEAWICDNCLPEYTEECAECCERVLTKVPRYSGGTEDDYIITTDQEIVHTDCAQDYEQCLVCEEYTNHKLDKIPVCEDCQDELPTDFTPCISCHTALGSYGELCESCAEDTHHSKMFWQSPHDNEYHVHTL